MFPIKDSKSPRQYPPITLLIIVINTIILFAQFFSPNPEYLTLSLALIPTELDFSQPLSLYPFVTSVFVHAGLLHYFFNMWFLYIFGDNVEDVLKSMPYLVFYLLGGVVASFIELLFIGDIPIPLLGASGAIAAILGFYLIFFPKNTITTLLPIFPIIAPLKLPAPIVLGLWFISQLLSGASSLNEASVSGGVAWWAHISGFVYGMVVAILYKVIQKISSALL